MALIRADELGEDLEDKAASAGEYDLRILKAEYKPTKKGDNHMLALMIRIEGADGEGTTPINVWLLEPKDEDAPATRRMRMRDIKRFCAVFGIPTDQGIDLEASAQDFVGQTGRCYVKKEPDDDNVDRNTLRLPKLD